MKLIKTDKDKNLESVKAFLPDDLEVIQIIQICQLYPTNSWRVWVDHLGNSLVILNDKKVISLREHPLSPSDKIITDIYQKAPPNKIAKNSKWALIAFAEGDKNNNQLCFLWMLGNDDRLRIITYVKDGWIENYPPLGCGMKTLRTIAKHLNIEARDISNLKEIKGSVAANIINAWATSLPLSAGVKLELLLSNKILASKIFEDCKI